ncbi:phenoloxidase-activating factor 1-like isoform X2 [Tribolium madens]|uniref:phenoloxidase-activating factor 1-like isoform X2 n=1 Tax=Tribolium madens TaxID=41895 RepID=UPI001CF73655|nr:phenoloxidase-activating factor 1-like isoform X2 [Tribolium madens]
MTRPVNEIYCYFIFSVFWILLYAQKNVTEEHVQTKMKTYCTTPEGVKGFCMPLSNCSNLVGLTNKTEARKHLKKSKCGPRKDDPDNPKVCCGTHNYLDVFPKICGEQNITIRGRILGGKVARLGEFPWLARLIHKRNGFKKAGCAGFLITSKFIVTAAHCLESDMIQYLGPLYEVVLGEHNTQTEIDCESKNKTCAPKNQVIRVKKTISHSMYDEKSKQHHHDIALIQLKKSAKFTSHVAPICVLEKVEFKPYEYWISGWGLTNDSNPNSQSSVKLKVSIPPFSHLNCSEKYKSIDMNITDMQLCAGGIKGKDSCSGDSGGPLMLVKNRNHWFAAGVVSYGLGCGKENWPGIYTNITSYTNWIRKTIWQNEHKKKKSKIMH